MNANGVSDSAFVQRMREIHEERRHARSLSEKVRLDEEMAALIRANHRGETFRPIEEPFDPKLAQTGEREPGSDDD